MHKAAVRRQGYPETSAGCLASKWSMRLPKGLYSGDQGAPYRESALWRLRAPHSFWRARRA